MLREDREMKKVEHLLKAKRDKVANHLKAVAEAMGQKLKTAGEGDKKSLKGSQRLYQEVAEVVKSCKTTKADEVAMAVLIVREQIDLLTRFSVDDKEKMTCFEYVAEELGRLIPAEELEKRLMVAKVTRRVKA